MATGVVKNVLSILGLNDKDSIQVTIGFLFLMLILLFINLKGTAFLTIISNLSTIGKMAALGITIIAGLIIIVTTGQNHMHEIDALTDASGKAFISKMNSTIFVTAVISAFYAFTGFESVASGASDMENPEKNLPRAIPLAIGIMPSIFAKRNSKDIPLNAFILTAALAIIIPMSFRYDMQGIMIISSIARFAQFIIVPLSVIVFFLGKQKEDIIDAQKNVITDVIFPALSVVLTLILLYKFNWKGQFSLSNANGTESLNWYAIIAMLIGYVVLPIVAYFYSKKQHLK